ncbi:MAG: hypothetical protein IPP93_05710 [Chitinophagaceae bacterium]|nr:hypothetical protein [Chitinophagaceae bacterium]
MTPKSILYFLSGLLILFFIYHFPEFFNSFWLMAACKIGFLVVAFVLARLQGWKGLGGYGLGFTNKWAADLVKGLLTGLFFLHCLFCFHPTGL